MRVLITISRMHSPVSDTAHSKASDSCVRVLLQHRLQSAWAAAALICNPRCGCGGLLGEGCEVVRGGKGGRAGGGRVAADDVAGGPVVRVAEGAEHLRRRGV